MGNCFWRSGEDILEACLQASGIHGLHMKSVRYLGLCVLRLGLWLLLLLVTMNSSWLLCVLFGTASSMCSVVWILLSFVLLFYGLLLHFFLCSDHHCSQRRDGVNGHNVELYL